MAQITTETVTFKALEGEALPLPLHERPAPSYARTIAEVLPELTKVRDPRVGGVTLPHEWRCMAAALGGITRARLEAAHTTGRPADLEEYRHAGQYLPPGLHTFTGQTGGGKTALVVNMALTALGGGHPVVYVSLELDAIEVAARLLALDGNLPWAPVALRREVSQELASRRDQTIATLAPAAERFVTLVPDGTNAAQLAADLRATTLRLWHDTGRQRAPLVIFDYLQAASILTLEQGRGASLREHIAAVTMDLRRLSRDGLPGYPDWMGCPVVVLSTTARFNVASAAERSSGYDERGPDELRQADLEALKAMPKEAGEVEATAVTAWVMALGETVDATGARPLTLRLAKSRMGPAGQWIPFTFYGSTGQLKEAPERYALAATADAAKAQEQEGKGAGKGKGKTNTTKGEPLSPSGNGYLV